MAWFNVVKAQQTVLQNVEEPEGEEFEVQRVIAVREYEDGDLDYFVVWSDESGSWERLSNLVNCHELVMEFLQFGQDNNKIVVPVFLQRFKVPKLLRTKEESVIASCIGLEQLLHKPWEQ